MTMIVKTLAWPNRRAAIDGGRKDQGIPSFRRALLRLTLDAPGILA
jgi:hypothetical protein